MNIPIYRAKKIDSNEWVEGTPLKVNQKTYMVQDGNSDVYTDSDTVFDDGSIDGEIRIFSNIYEVDTKTLAINLPNMLDKNRKKIFASFSKDGIGGDKCINPSWIGKDALRNKMVALWTENVMCLKFITDEEISLLSYSKIEVIGIHKGK